MFHNSMGYHLSFGCHQESRTERKYEELYVFFHLNFEHGEIFCAHPKGWRSMYSGLNAGLLRSVVANGGAFVVYEWVSGFLLS